MSRWWWINNILRGVPEDVRREAEAAAAGHATPILPALPFTEADPRWVLLYDHARRGQIRPDRIRWMRRRDLEFLAGMGNPDPAMFETDVGRSEATKLLGNVARAASVAQRRTVIRTAWISSLGGASIGDAVGSLVTIALR